MDLHYYFFGFLIISYFLIGMVRFIQEIMFLFVKKKYDTRLMSKLSLKK